MGMELIGHRLTRTELQAVLDDPDTVEDLLYGDLEDEDAEMPGPHLDLGKDWHGMHYLLTGTAWELGSDPTGSAILGGTEIGTNGGYGPPRLLEHTEVRAVAAALDAVNLDTLRARFDPAAMKAAEIYPNVWHRSDLKDLLAQFEYLRQFYRAAADDDQAIILAIG